MVHNPVWKSAWPEGQPHKLVLRRHANMLFPDAPRTRHPDKHGRQHVLVHVLLCFGCLEERIGRALELDDFQLVNRDGTRPLPINAGILLGYRMATRAIEQSRRKIGDKKDEGG